jgi:hypothetical protein
VRVFLRRYSCKRKAEANSVRKLKITTFNLRAVIGFPLKNFSSPFFFFQIGKATGKLKNFIIEPFVAHKQVNSLH